MTEERKYYTTIKVFNCVSKEDKRYNAVCAVLSLSNIREKTVGDKLLVEARCAINNRTKTINGSLGTSFAEDVIWADVTLWEDKATRFLKFAGDRTKLTLGIMGTIKADRFKKGDGTDGESITISVDEWFNVSGSKSEAAPAFSSTAYDSFEEYVPTEYIPRDDDPF